MKKYQIIVQDKKTSKIIKQTTLSTNRDIGIILQGKIQLLGEGFKVEKKKHIVNFAELI